jgi:hypothetical protein
MRRAILCAVRVLTAPQTDRSRAGAPPGGAAATVRVRHPVGYLVDNTGQLNLRDDQLARLQDIDRSLRARRRAGAALTIANPAAN